MDSNDNRVRERILTESAGFYHQHLTDDARVYLVRERGINEDTINRFQIGFAEGGLKEHLIGDLGYQEEICIKTGVLKRAEDGEVRDYFVGRIVFPNIRRGSVVNFTGRGIDGRAPKYLHLPGEILHLYNEDALEQKEVIIAEGVPDCLTAVQAGYPAVALFGANNFKPQFVHKFGRCEKVYVCLDGDRAGAAGTLMIGALLPDKAYVVKLPSGWDLNDYVLNRSVDDLRQLIQSSEKHLYYLLNQIPNNLEKTELPPRLEPILEILARLSPQSAEHFLEHEIKNRFGFTVGEVRAYRSDLAKKRKGSEMRKKARFDQGGPRTECLAKFPQLIDIVEQDDSPTYLIKSESVVSLIDHIEIGGVRCVPPPKNQLPWKLPNGQRVLQEYENCRLNPRAFAQRLYDDIIEYLRGISDLPDEKFYDLLTCWCIHTHLFEGAQYTPILCFFAVPERGKSRTGKALIYLSYRGVHVESLREAYIIRLAENLGCSIFFDVRDIWKKAERLGSEDILLLRYEKGAIVSRVLYPEKGRFRDTEYFSIFGPTLIATNERMEKILETRAISINMPQAQRDFAREVVPETALPLKERLVALRGFYSGQPLPEPEKLTPGRLGDILRPLHQVVRMIVPEKEERFVSLVRALADSRLLDKSLTLEAEILRAVRFLRTAVTNGTLPVMSVTNKFNEDRDEREKFTSHRIGRILTAIGFDRRRTGTGAAAIVYDSQKISRFLTAYGVEEPSETSDLPAGRTTGRRGSDVSGDSDV